MTYETLTHRLPALGRACILRDHPGGSDMTFSRIEMRVASKDDLLLAALELKQLAGDLEFIAGQRQSEEEAAVLARHKIKQTSQRLRGTHAD